MVRRTELRVEVGIVVPRTVELPERPGWMVVTG